MTGLSLLNAPQSSPPTPTCPGTVPHDTFVQHRQLALQLHPDKNPCPRAQDAFRRIKRAFEVLKDPPKRAVYDRSMCLLPNRAMASMLSLVTEMNGNTVMEKNY